MSAVTAPGEGRAGRCPGRRACYGPPVWPPAGGFDRTLRHTLGGIVAALWLVLAVLRFGSLWLGRDETLGEAERRASNLALILAAYLQSSFDAADASLRQLSIHGSRVGGPAGAAGEWAPLLASAKAGLSGIGSLTVADAAGIVRQSTMPGIVGESRADRYVYRRLSTDPQDIMVVDTPFRGRGPGAPLIIPLGRRLSGAGGAFEGIVVATFQPAQLRRFFKTVDVGPGGILWVFHRDGQVVFREPSVADPMGENASGNALFKQAGNAAGPGTQRAPAAAGGPRLVNAWRPLDHTPLIVVVSLSEQDVLAQWRKDAALSAGLLAVLGIAAALVMRVVLRQVDARQKAEQALVRSQRLESIAHLTGGVAHDFNNLLMVILGNVARLRKAGVASGPAAHAVHEVEQAAQRAAELTARLLAFARRQPLQPRVVDLNQPLDAVEPMLKRLLSEDVTLRINRPGRPCRAHLDPVQWESAVMNLCVNARDAMPKGGLLLIELSLAELDQTHARQDPEIPPGRYVLLSVSDTGEGIPAANLAHIFEPFFTTKEAGQGTGLGLPSVHGFVTQSGGHIKVYSEVGHGTRFRLYFPEAAATGQTETAPPPPEPPGDLGAGETVLLVEDETSVRELAREMLEELGYRVLAAADGREALALAAKHPEVDLVFTDVMLPNGMNGRQVAEELWRQRPGLPVVFASGYSQDIVEHRGEIGPGLRLVTKPYRFNQVADALRAALNEARGADRG